MKQMKNHMIFSLKATMRDQMFLLKLINTQQKMFLILFYISTCLGMLHRVPQPRLINRPVNRRQPSLRSTRHSVTRSNLHIHFGADCIPNIENDFDCGEDALDWSLTSRFASLIIADGIGSTKKPSGSALLSNAIVSYGAELVQVDALSQTYYQDMSRLVVDAFQRSTPLPKNLTGATTFTAGIVDLETGVLKTAVLGDSAILVIRNNQVAFRTRAVLSTWNTPVQLTYRSELESQENIKMLQDKVRQTEQLSFQLVKGDLIIGSTDGMLDNLHEAEIVDILESIRVERTAYKVAAVYVPAYIAHVLAETASQAAQGVIYKSQRPFYASLDFFRAFCERNLPLGTLSDADRSAYQRSKMIPSAKLGGKKDDMSVIVGIVE